MHYTAWRQKYFNQLHEQNFPLVHSEDGREGGRRLQERRNYNRKDETGENGVEEQQDKYRKEEKRKRWKGKCRGKD